MADLVNLHIKSLPIRVPVLAGLGRERQRMQITAQNVIIKKHSLPEADFVVDRTVRKYKARRRKR